MSGGLWAAARKGLTWSPDGRWVDEPQGPTDANRRSAVALLRRTRWAALGPPYDWTQRRYDTSCSCRSVPTAFAERATTLALALAGTPLRADVALVNYYQAGDSLSGHTDDAEGELGMHSPLVSFSLGCPAVFLLVRGISCVNRKAYQTTGRREWHNRIVAAIWRRARVERRSTKGTARAATCHDACGPLRAWRGASRGRAGCANGRRRREHRGMDGARANQHQRQGHGSGRTLLHRRRATRRGDPNMNRQHEQSPGHNCVLYPRQLQRPR